MAQISNLWIRRSFHPKLCNDQLREGEEVKITSYELRWRKSFERVDDKLSFRPTEVEVAEGQPCEIIQQAHGNVGGEVRTKDRPESSIEIIVEVMEMD